VKTSGLSRWSDRVVNEAEARSFMNYPDRVAAGYYGFFDTFEYRFSDQELVFLRHAPESLIKMGGSAWGTDHAGSGMTDPLEPSNADPQPSPLQLIVRSNKLQPVYQFLELVTLELKLTNVGSEPRQVPKEVLEQVAEMNIVVTRNGRTVKNFKPYAVPCDKEDPMIELKPQESLFGDLSLAGGKFGWVVDEPGTYQVTVTRGLSINDSDMVLSSQPFTFVVLEPGKFDKKERKAQEGIAADYFSDEVGRTLAMGGTQVLTGANDTLQELIERFPDANAAKQADITLTLPNVRNYKQLRFNADGSKRIDEQAADAKAGEAIKKALVHNGAQTAEVLGHVGYHKVCEKVAVQLKNNDDVSGAVEVQEGVLAAMKERKVNLPEKVKQDIADKVTALKS
jgi:hypothetical protein